MNETHIDLLLKNCKAYAMDEKNTCYTTIGIHDGRIVYTGQADEDSAPCAKTVIDMAGRPVLPAFTDTHMHMIATVYKGNIIKNLIMDCQSYTKYRPNETTGGIFVSWRRKEELPTGA